MQEANSLKTRVHHTLHLIGGELNGIQVDQENREYTSRTGITVKCRREHIPS